MISAKTEYACLAMLELAANYHAGEPVRLREITDLHDIPSPFLVQILLQLKGAGLVRSTRGASGGYQLARAPSDITLAEVMAVVEGSVTDVTSNSRDETPTSRVLLNAWREAAEAHAAVLESITLAQLVKQARGQTHEMYYI